jgi:putative solute:sodium symporter small subunit
MRGEANGGGGSGSGGAPAGQRAERARAYWQRNLRYVAVLLSVWLSVSLVGGVLLAGPLNGIRIPGTGFRLGFWIAQQGAIYVFVVLIFVYVRLMNRLDRELGLEDD